MRSWGERFLLPSYAELETRAAELEARAVELGDDPSEATLLAAQDAWWQARTPWKRADLFGFGPYALQPERYGPKIDFWPGRPDTVLEVLESDTPLDADGLELVGAPAKGFTALEYLLFEPDIDLIEAFAATPRRAAYAAALSADLAARTRELAAAWDPASGNYLGELLDGGRGSASFSTLDAALGEVVNRAGYALENDRLEKLGRPLGDKADGTAQPELCESPWSGRSQTDLGDNLAGIALVYRGDAASGVLGLDQYLRYRGRELTTTFEARFVACEAALAGVSLPFTQAVVDEPEALRTLMSELAALQRFFQVDVISALSLSVGFNDNDGD